MTDERDLFANGQLNAFVGAIRPWPPLIFDGSMRGLPCGCFDHIGELRGRVGRSRHAPHLGDERVVAIEAAKLGSQRPRRAQCFAMSARARARRA